VTDNLIAPTVADQDVVRRVVSAGRICKAGSRVALDTLVVDFDRDGAIERGVALENRLVAIQAPVGIGVLEDDPAGEGAVTAGRWRCSWIIGSADDYILLTLDSLGARHLKRPEQVVRSGAETIVLQEDADIGRRYGHQNGGQRERNHQLNESEAA